MSTTSNPAASSDFWPMLRSHVRAHPGQVALVVALLGGEILAELAKPWPMKFVIDYLTSIEGGDPTTRVGIPGDAGSSVTSFILFASALIIGFAVFDALVTYFGVVARSRLGTTIGLNIRRQVFGHLQRLGLDFHYGQRSGELTTRVVNDTSHIEDFAAQSLPTLVRVVVTFASMVGIMFWLDWRLALLTACVIPPVMYTVIVRFVTAIRTRSKVQRKSEGSLAAVTQETLQSIQVVKAFSREDFTDELFDRENQDTRDARMATIMVEGKFTPTIKTLVQVGVVMLLAFGILRVRAGALSTGDLWIFVAYFRGVKGPLKDMSSGLRQLARTEVRWDQIRGILDTDSTSDDPSRKPAPKLQGQITLDRVSFSYDSNDDYPTSPVLRVVDLDVEAGSHIAIVGATGAGKSTLVSLIAGLYEPSYGKVLIDGQSLAKLKPETVRSQMAFVLQESLLFATTLGNNIGYGRLDATPYEIVEAAKQARIHDFIMTLPDGYDTVIGERGTTLSGGQRQRIAIARALLRDAPILILDEPVTGLDQDTHDEVWSEMRELMVGRTTILITHDPELAADMDETYVLSNGLLEKARRRVSTPMLPPAPPPPPVLELEAGPLTTTPVPELVPAPIPSAETVGDWERVVVIGQGYVGLPIALRAVEQGFDVVGFDTDPARIGDLLASRSFIEDVSDQELTDALNTGRFHPTVHETQLQNFDHAIIAVPTPLRDGTPDLTYIEIAGRTLATMLQPGATVVLESTTYPGTTEDLLAPILEAGSGLQAGVDYALGYSPERINPGDQTFGFVHIPKVVAGIDKASLDQVAHLYDRLVDTVVPVQSTKVAELTKLLENTFRHVNIALVNELCRFAHELDIDIWEAIDAAATKPFGFMPFRPGPGVGGHCLPVDPSYLSWDVKRSLGQSFRFVELANDINEQMPDYVINRLVAGMNQRAKSIKDHRFLVLGAAYKPNSSDTRQSPALRVISKLAGLGAEIKVVDPHVVDPRLPEGVTTTVLSPAEVQAADVVVVLVAHDAFDFALVEESANYAFDCTHRLGNYPHIEFL